MKKMLSGFVALVLVLMCACGLEPTIAEERYSQELADNVTIDVIGSLLPNEAYAAYQGMARGYELEMVAGMFLKAPSSSQTVTQPRGIRTMLTNEANEYISIDLADKTGTSSITYIDLATQGKYPWLLIPEIWRAMALEDGGDLSFMTEPEFIAQCESTLRILNPDFEPTLVYVRAYNADKLNSIKQWLYNNDQEYKISVDNGKITPKEKYNKEDEVYKASFTFKLDGLPVYGNTEPRLSLPYEEAETLANPMYAEITYGKDGAISLSLAGAVQIGGSLEERAILTIADASICVARLFDDIILTAPVNFTGAYVEYIPMRRVNGSVELTPTWCFRTAGTDEHDDGEAYRINAFTGDVIK